MRKLLTLFAGLLALGASQPAQAKSYELRVLGNFQGQLQSSDVERPFFEHLGKATGGTFDVQFRTMDEVGLKGFDALRMTRLGIFDIMAVQLGYVSGDEPFVLGVDLPGVSPDLKTAQAVVDAYRKPFTERLEKKYGVTPLAIWPYPGQVFFCKSPITGLADLKGRKVRSFTPAMSKLIEYFGGVPVTLAFSEVYQALQRGVVDCAITGSLSGNTAKWFEVTNYLYPLSIGWGIQAHVVNDAYFAKLSPHAQQQLTTQMHKMDAEMWDLAARTFQDGVNCNTGTGPCKYGIPAKMHLVPVKPEDRVLLKKAVESYVLPDWGKTCNASYPDCTKVWNATIGKVVNMTIH